MPVHVSALPDTDAGSQRWHPLADLAARLDRQADEADKAAVQAGLLVYRTGRWRRTYRDSRFLTDEAE